MKNEIPDQRMALSFLAHPDDAEILCAGTLIRLADAGWEVHIATVASGGCGSVTLPAEEIAEIRRGEAITAAQKIGATYHCVKERDVNVVFAKATNRKAIDLFRRVATMLVLTHPRHDDMLDHEQVHLLARSASFSHPIPNASSLPLVDGSVIPHLYYCDPLEAKDPYSGEPVQPTSTSTINKEIKMLACHASQREWLGSHHGMDEYIEAMKRHCASRGEERNTFYAEAFVQHRGHAYPQSDILHELFEGKLDRFGPISYCSM